MKPLLAELRRTVRRLDVIEKMPSTLRDRVLYHRVRLARARLEAVLARVDTRRR